ncbi:hypothetical protein HN777_00605 [Candidatus Woesearchaeota archaeon]|jgi:hypothetical protein|nr:hypothetical protein [Candidatus Woesearchaeota archaeon]
MDKIPQLKIEDGKVVEDTISVDIVVNDNTEHVVMKKLSSGEAGKIRSAHVKTRYLAGQPSMNVDESALKDGLLQAAIVSAPFEHDLEGIKNLPDDVNTYLFTAWSNFSNPTPAKKD